MAVPDGTNDRRPGSYSHALLASANIPRDWEPAIAAIRKPTEVLIGEDDELFFAKAYSSELGRANPRIYVTLLPKVGHMGMVYQPKALKTVSDKVREMLRANQQK